MENYLQAVVLCAGKATRLRPYSYILPKSSLPFLNLPLLAYPWFYLENLKVSRFLLNSHLFPLQLKQTVNFLSKDQQSVEVFFEEEPLGAIGTLLRLKNKLKAEPYFALINGDSLFFPSDKQTLQDFKKDFFKSQCDVLFFVTPYEKNPIGRALFADSQLFLKKVESLKKFEKLKNSKVTDSTPYAFTGLALFKSSVLDSIVKPSSESRHARESGHPFHQKDFFQDFILPLIHQYKIKLFVDKATVLLEAGSKSSYLQSTEFCLKQLFCKKWDSSSKREKNTKPSYKQILQDCFQHFDPRNQRIGFDKQALDRWGSPALIPSSVKGTKHLKIKGFAVLGPHTQLFGPSLLEKSVLDSHTHFRGSLSNELLLSSKPL